MELSQQVCNLDLAKRLIAKKRSRSTIEVYEVLPQMSARETPLRILRAQKSSLGKRAIPLILQGLYSGSTSEVVLQTGRPEADSRSTEGSQKGRARLLSCKASKASLGLKNRRSECLWRQVRLLPRNRAEVFSYRPHKWRWQQTPKDFHVHNLCVAAKAQLSARLQSALPQLQYGDCLLGRMSS